MKSTVAPYHRAQAGAVLGRASHGDYTAVWILSAYATEAGALSRWPGPIISCEREKAGNSIQTPSRPMGTMKNQLTLSLVLIVLCNSCAATIFAQQEVGASDRLGQFHKRQDLYLAHFDLKTDVDDVHSVAAVATMLSDRRFAGVSYHAVAGAYGTQGGLYVPANELFELAFASHWSDAHADFEQAVAEVSDRVIKVLRAGGRIWIAEGGQSDFSAALIRNVQQRLPDADLKDRIHIVQHADWNEEVTTKADLSFVNDVASYQRIPTGNKVGNGTPGFRSDEKVDWRSHVSDAHLRTIWETAIAIADTYNGADNRYLNKSIDGGGLDFSDATETTWIFGFNDLVDANDFFEEFSSDQPAFAD